METKVCVGIDICKDSFDVFLPFSGKAGYQHLKFTNKTAVFKNLCSQLPAASHCVMEASGGYYLPLAVYLHGQGMRVSVVNPLTIKRFAQMRLMRSKTDKKDAAIITEYGMVENPALWQSRAEYKHSAYRWPLILALLSVLIVVYIYFCPFTYVH